MGTPSGPSGPADGGGVTLPSVAKGARSSRGEPLAGDSGPPPPPTASTTATAATAATMTPPMPASQSLRRRRLRCSALMLASLSRVCCRPLLLIAPILAIMNYYLRTYTVARAAGGDARGFADRE